MSFLGAAFLMALPLVAVPVAIHLYRGRQRDVIPWGAMQFLTAAATKGRSLERLEELLLMLLRLVAIAALVLALAQPMIRSSWLGHGADGELVLVLDNSLSMSREMDGESAISRLKRQAADAIDAASSGESVQIVLAAGAEWATTEGVLADAAGKRQLLQIVEDLAPTQGRAELLECVRAAIHLHAPEGLSRRRIVVLTDNQSTSWRPEAEGPWQQVAAARDAADVPITIEVIDSGLPAGRIDNLAVGKLDAVQKLVRPGDELAVTAQIVNAGDALSSATQLEWLVGEKVVQTAPLATLAAGASTQATAALRMETAGTFLVICRIVQADQIPLDQDDALVVEVADRTPILVVQAASEPGMTLSAADLINAALGYSDGKPNAWHSVYQPEVIEPAALAGRSLGGVRAVLIDSLADLDGDSIERLNDFVRAGGGLWVGLGDRVDRERFNRDWYGDGAGLSPVALAVVDSIENAEAVAGTVHPPSREHPATMQLANTTQLDIDEARVTQRWTFAPRPTSAAAVSTLLESGDSRPLIVEHFVGQGRVLVQAMPLGLQWSNLPLLKAYVVMIHDGLDYITAPTSARFNLAPGTPIVTLADGAAKPDATATLTTPRGHEISLRMTASGFAPAFRYSQTRLPGVYRLRTTLADGATSEVPFHVERDAKESDVRALTDDQRQQLAAIGIQFAGEAAVARPAAAPAPRREPVWGALLTALVALLAAELLLASWLGRQRHGFPVNAA